MSKIYFYKGLKNELETKFEPSPGLTEFIKEYVNSLDILPNKNTAIDYIIKNYKPGPKKEKPTEFKKPEPKKPETEPKLNFDNIYKDMTKNMSQSDKDGIPKCPQQ